MAERLCLKCGKTPQEAEFGLRDGGTRYQSYCKKCLYAFQVRRWTDRKLKAVAHLGGCCQDCKKTWHHAVYEFHHRDPSQKDVEWTKLRKRTWAKVLIELDKCDLLCANCHRIRHATEREADTLMR